MTTKRLSGQLDKYFDALGPRTVKGRAGKDQTDLEGDQLPPSGCVPQSGDVPLLDSHDPTKVLGRAEFHVSGDELLVTATFAREGVDPKYRHEVRAGKGRHDTGILSRRDACQGRGDQGQQAREALHLIPNP